MNLSKIPQELKARPQWVLWKSEIRDGKPTKIPYCPQDQKRKAEADNPATWGTRGPRGGSMNAKVEVDRAKLAHVSVFLNSLTDALESLMTEVKEARMIIGEAADRAYFADVGEEYPEPELKGPSSIKVKVSAIALQKHLEDLEDMADDPAKVREWLSKVNGEFEACKAV